MSRAQRLTFLAIAAAIAIIAVVALSSSGGDEEPTTASARSTATPAATATAEPAATAAETPPEPKPEPPLVIPGKPAKLRFTQGETIRFRVRADTADHVHVHVYDLMQDVEPGKTITFSFPAEITGIFEIELEDAGEEIGQLRVDPA